VWGTIDKKSDKTQLIIDDCREIDNLKLLINKIKTRNILTYSIKNKKADVLIFDIIQNKLKTSFKLKINS